MKQIFILTFIFFTTIVYGQQQPAAKLDSTKLFATLQKMKAGREYQIDENSPIEVIYTKEHYSDKIAYFLNGQLIPIQSRPALATIPPKTIDSIKILKNAIRIGEVDYYGIYITTKSDSVNFISLNRLKEKYTNSTNKFVVFMIDHNIIKADYDKFIINENYILQITVDTITVGEEPIDILRILTKTKENIDNVRREKGRIRIRG